MVEAAWVRVSLDNRLERAVNLEGSHAPAMQEVFPRLTLLVSKVAPIPSGTQDWWTRPMHEMGKMVSYEPSGASKSPVSGIG